MQKVYLSPLAHGEIRRAGIFLAMDNQVDPQTGTVKAKARFDNEKNALFPSQFVNVKLQLRNVQGAVVVPVNAMRHGANGDYVYVLNQSDRTVALRPIKRGLATTDKVQVVSGLNVGEQVITEGADRLRDGAKVMLPGDRPAGGAGGWNGGRRQGGKNAQGAQGTQGTQGVGAQPDGAAQAGRGQWQGGGQGAGQGGERRRRQTQGQGQGAEAQ